MQADKLLGRVAVALCLLILAGCSPTFNWREVRVGTSDLRVLLPCKPEAASRKVPVFGHESTLLMVSCDAGDITFAVSTLSVSSGSSPVSIADAWKRATLAGLKADPAQVRGWAVPARAGMAMEGWEVMGARHTGQPVRVRVLGVRQGENLFQLAVYGEPLPEVLSTFVDGARFAPLP